VCVCVCVLDQVCAGGSSLSSASSHCVPLSPRHTYSFSPSHETQNANNVASLRADWHNILTCAGVEPLPDILFSVHISALAIMSKTFASITFTKSFPILYVVIGSI